jgi:hypothetical protein
MIPSDKARELYLKYYGIPLYVKTVKQCCHIAVDEMLNEYPAQCPDDSYEKERHLYWMEVKNEINAL